MKNIKKLSVKAAGGPSTPEGKAKSSQNALKLGANTMRPSNPTEQQLVDDFVFELTQYYEPQSPLEKLQIQRIAICRAKLARLYEVERAQIELAQKAISNEPQRILAEMKVPKGLVRSMVEEAVRRGAISFPLGLNIATLEVIAHEVDSFHGTLNSEDDLLAGFPKLMRFIKQYPARGLTDPNSLTERLEVALRRLYRAMRHDIYFGELAEVIEELFYPEKTSSKYDEDAERLLKQIQPNYVAPEPAKKNIDYVQLQTLLQLFVHLNFAHTQAQDILKKYQETHALILQSALLPTGEAELLMRYQTTWERRLSSLMGEFLELQKCR